MSRRLHARSFFRGPHICPIDPTALRKFRSVAWAGLSEAAGFDFAVASVADCGGGDDGDDVCGARLVPAPSTPP